MWQYVLAAGVLKVYNLKQRMTQIAKTSSSWV